MKLFAFIAIVATASLLSHAVAVETETDAEWIDPVLPSHLTVSGYIPMASPADNPNTASLISPVPSISHDPECAPRPQTIAEIHRMRESASRIAHAVEHEVAIMRRRKQFVEQMTAYLNDRIVELNKVKNELAEEVRWIELSQHRIQELSEKEKLVKLQDVLQCVNAGKGALEQASTQKAASSAALAAKAKEIEDSVNAIKEKITSLESTGAAPSK